MEGSGPRAQRADFPRLNAPVRCRPRGLRWLHERPPSGVSLGGARIYSDERMAVGAQLDLELFLPDGSTVSAGAEVAFVDELPGGAPARFDVGLRFLELQHADRSRLAAVLAR